ncbi:hypothetical protein ACTA71_000240 [Dictyostelium dimigraforme]
MKIIFLYFLFYLISKIECLDPPRCYYGEIYSSYDSLKPQTRDYVDWWIYEHFNGGGAIYTDSNLKTKIEKILELDNFNMREVNTISPITKTFKQVSMNQYSSIAYNEGYKKKSVESKGYAHEKGFFIWNEEGGIHVIHSVPKTPTKNDYFFLDTSEDTHMQHSICITLKPSELDIIPKFLIYTNPVISLINSKMLTKPACLSKIRSLVDLLNGIDSLDVNPNLIPAIDKVNTFIGMDRIIESNFYANSILSKEIKILQWSQLAFRVVGREFTSNDYYTNMHYYKVKSNWLGDYFVQTSDENLYSYVPAIKKGYLSQMGNVEILWQYIGKYYNSNGKAFSKWISQTMTKVTPQGFPQIGNTFSLTFRLNYPFLKDKNEKSASFDHSKLMYGISDDKTLKMMCLGGLNYQMVQDRRGGGAFCSNELGYLVDYLKRHVSWTRKGITGDDAKLGVPQSTVGTLVDLSWIRNTFTLNEISEIMAFEISVPNSPHPLLKRMVEPSTSYYRSNNTQLLINQESTNPDTYKTEEISIDVFPSIENKVHLCKESGCNFQSTIKLNIASNLKLTVKVVNPETPKMSIESDPNRDPNLKIDVTTLTKGYYLTSRITNSALLKFGSSLKINKIELIETSKNDGDYSFAFPINPTLDSVCKKFSLVDGTLSLEFHPKCIDLLAFCLHRELKMNIEPLLNDDIFLQGMDQNIFIRKIMRVITELVPNNSGGCIMPLSNDQLTINNMQHNSINNI